MRTEPIIHSDITDELPESHPLAFKNVSCHICHSDLHCETNECMQTWVEWEEINICSDCFARILLEHDGVLSRISF